MKTTTQDIPYEVYVEATNELFALRALNAELLEGLKAIEKQLEARRRVVALHQVQLLIAKAEGRE